MELSGKVGDILLVPVGDVAGGADLEFFLRDPDTLLERHLRTLRGLRTPRSRSNEDKGNLVFRRIQQCSHDGES